MKAKQVEIGKCYWARVSGQVVPVRVTNRVIDFNGRTRWHAINTKTGRRVYIRSAARLRGEVPERRAKDGI